jgi:hypothetical protein
LEQGKTAYEQEGKSLSLSQQQETFSVLKQQRPSLKSVHSQVLQNVAVRIDLARSKPARSSVLPPGNGTSLSRSNVNQNDLNQLLPRWVLT